MADQDRAAAPDRRAHGTTHDVSTGDTARDRAVGALLGLACGDAVGTTLEFKPPGSFAPIDDMVGGGPFHLRPGEWTDDTSMALCLAESLLDRGDHDPADQMRRYVLWREEGYLSSTGVCFDIGTTVMRQLTRYARTGEPVDPRPDQESAANGSLMRLAPAPIRWHADIERAVAMAAESSRPTHAADRPVDACRVMAAMVVSLIQGADIDEVFGPSFWRWGDLHPEIAAVAAGSWRNKSVPEVRGSGYCVAALEAAVWAVAGADDFREAVLRAANLGDDADTTAAIAGQLAGARWGAGGIPSEWLDQLVLRDRIEALASGLFDAGVMDAVVPVAVGPDGTGTPPGTSGSDGTAPLGCGPSSSDDRSTDAPGAGGAADRGSAPSDGRWPHDAGLHAWWVTPGRVLAGEYPGDTDPAAAAEKVGLLVDHGVRTFVDLTGPDDPLTPYADVVTTAAARRRLDLRALRFTIPDFSVIDDEGYDEIVDAIRAEQQRGVVYLHCWGGVGRTGTVVGCLLAHDGVAADDIADRLTALRAGTRKAARPCPETDAQRAVIARRAARLA